MLKILRQASIIQCNQIHSYTQETYIFIYIQRYSSTFIAIGVRLTKYQQILSDRQPATQQMFTRLFTY